ncbi:Fatty-acid amide hydrolase 1 [Fasciolopsis buskii]|uniref:Fatty-acid amide hydrolase 1 n=1 Tax=Fasciolopsis buskii TaxID=27845 RepID=A0A8E0VHE6_9TREM|nr:Fatty-acid amide hydrolase 1 [Fasciolopsis buski]
MKMTSPTSCDFRVQQLYLFFNEQWKTLVSLAYFFTQRVCGQFSRKTCIVVTFTLICVHLGLQSINCYRLRRRLSVKRKQIAQKTLLVKSVISDVTRETTEFLTECDPEKLQLLLRSGSLTPSDLLHAFQAKVLRLWDSGNSGVCELIVEANDQANQLNGRIQQNDTVAPLYGIPVSLKELCSVRGYDATFGLLKRCNQPALDDCVLVRALKLEGVIPFVLTATSQLALATSGFNPVTGRMTNPHSVKHEPGGSSCGEGVLICRHGSIVGLATDIGGSIRIPAHFCGVVGLKATAHRLSTQGITRLNENSVFMIRLSAGPMARRVNDLAEMMRTLLRPSMFSLDPTVPPLPFNEKAYQGKDKANLTIGYYETFEHPSLLKTVPAVRRAVRQAVNLLAKQGHRMIKFDTPDPFRAMQLSLRAMSVDGGSSTGISLAWEPLSKHTSVMKIASLIPSYCLPLFDKLTRHIVGPPMALGYYVRGFQKPSDAVQLASEIVAYRSQYAKAWAEAGPLDALICPVSIYPAPSIDMPAYFEIPSFIYTVLYNLVDYPAGSVPIDHVNQQDIEEANRAMEEAKKRKEGCYESLFRYQSDTLGLPLGVQVVSKPFQEELVLRVMRELEHSRTRNPTKHVPP